MIYTVAALCVSGAAAYQAAVPLSRAAGRSAAVRMETKADLEKLAGELNPVVGFYDPLELSDMEFWGQSNEATIGWLREAEIKHSRIAMAGFVGYIVHENNIRTQGDGIVASIPTGLSAPAVWDALPDIAKWQIILFVGVMESWRENKVVLASEGEKHYMRGGKPGYFPTFDLVPHPVPFNLYDPFKVMPKKTDEQKARGLLVEINNGRAAMLGLMAFLSEACAPGSVPLLKGVVMPYDGSVLAPFTNNVFTNPTVL